ncbi:MAG TPA: GAF domain-containing sensor histidine kinase, partial [Chloroflexota bacterium]|nr:GAF domain-containing sensor histidine kinase [Chloroflexota bacterium]
ALEALLRGAIRLLDGDEAVAQVRDPDDGGHTVLLRMDRSGAVVGRSRRSQPVPGSHAAALLAGAPSMLVHDFAALDEVTYPLRERMLGRGVRSAVNVGIRVSGRAIGSLHVNHHRIGQFGSAELSLAQLLASHAAAPIERVRLDAERRAAERTVERQALGLQEAAAEAAALRRLDELKKEFFSTITHELRGPLTVLLGYCSRLRERAASYDAESLRQIAARMERSAGMLNRLIGDMLDFARIERGELEVNLGALDLPALVGEVVAGFQGAPGAGRLRLDLPEAAFVLGDATRTMQVVSNLINNALKYAPQGEVWIRVRGVEGAVRVEVEDSGPGIPPEEMDRVWEKFFRGAGGEGFSVAQGTGLGLAVVKALVEAQGGRVGVWSEPGKGARFWFELPAASGMLPPRGNRVRSVACG